VQTLDYYPYGSQRIATGSHSEQRRFIGEEYDGDTEFSYLNARYYQASRGQFMSQDPVFWNFMSDHMALLSDPQQMNSYSYSRNNPLRYIDPTGESIEIKATLTQMLTFILTFLRLTGGPNDPAAGNGETIAPVEAQPKKTTWDPLTDTRIIGLDARVRQSATNFINRTETELGVQLRVTQGYRSKEEQDKLFMSSRTNPPGPWRTDAKGGQSYHNYGLAIDVVRTAARISCI
jgi:RHS repeat-associated protein